MEKLKYLILSGGDLMKNDKITKNTKFKTSYGTIAKVVNYDDTSGLYIYKDNYNNTGYKSDEYILNNLITVKVYDGHTDMYTIEYFEECPGETYTY